MRRLRELAAPSTSGMSRLSLALTLVLFLATVLLCCEGGRPTPAVPPPPQGASPPTLSSACNGPFRHCHTPAIDP